MLHFYPYKNKGDHYDRLKQCRNTNRCPCSAINYCNLNGYELTAEEKIIFLSSYVSRIDNETVYQPATREFVQNFNVDAAISIINNYATADSFFRRMTGSFPYIKNSQRFSSPDIYFLLLELKLYINERRRVIAKIIQRTRSLSLNNTKTVTRSTSQPPRKWKPCTA